MAKDRNKVLHIHSSIEDRQPTPATLEPGEIAVNNNAGHEFISTKNNNNEVVRFSSDKQLVDLMEYKEVIPYSGVVDNVHLDTNKSNIEIKLNQVVSNNTAFHNKVNGAKDIDGDLVNPTSDSGLTNGAGFAIDMSRYAMIGANPSFSSLTVDNGCTIGDTLIIREGLEKNLSWTYGDVKVANSGSTNFKEDGSFVIPKCASDINRAKLQVTYGATSDKSGSVTYDPGDNCDNTISKTINVPTCVSDLNRAKFDYTYGSVSGKSSTDNGTYDPGDNCDNAVSKTIVIPTCIAELKNWNGSCYSLDSDVCVSGDVTATGSFYSTSDERKKENIKPIGDDTKLKARNVHLKSFNYIEDSDKRTLYGVIAQDVEAAGLNELVHTDEQGIKAVDYTSFLILRISYLEKLIGQMNSKIIKLEEEINKK